MVYGMPVKPDEQYVLAFTGAGKSSAIAEVNKDDCLYLAAKAPKHDVEEKVTVTVVCVRTGALESDRMLYHEFRNNEGLQLAAKVYLKHLQNEAVNQRKDDAKSVSAPYNSVLTDCIRQYASNISTLASAVASTLVVVATGEDQDDVQLNLASQVGCSALYFMLHRSCCGSGKLERPVAEAVLQVLQDVDEFESVTRRVTNVLGLHVSSDAGLKTALLQVLKQKAGDVVFVFQEVKPAFTEKCKTSSSDDDVNTAIGPLEVSSRNQQETRDTKSSAGHNNRRSDESQSDVHEKPPPTPPVSALPRGGKPICFNGKATAEKCEALSGTKTTTYTCYILRQPEKRVALLCGPLITICLVGLVVALSLLFYQPYSMKSYRKKETVQMTYSDTYVGTCSTGGLVKTILYLSTNSCRLEDNCARIALLRNTSAENAASVCVPIYISRLSSVKGGKRMSDLRRIGVLRLKRNTIGSGWTQLKALDIYLTGVMYSGDLVQNALATTRKSLTTLTSCNVCPAILGFFMYQQIQHLQCTEHRWVLAMAQL